MVLRVYTDGGSRGNPGPAAIGIVLVKDEVIILEHKDRIGRGTNNEAEYRALIKGLRLAREQDVELECFSDSELMIKQLNGDYRVKKEDLKKLFDVVQDLISGLKSVYFTHVRRSNKFITRADELVNQALDFK